MLAHFAHRRWLRPSNVVSTVALFVSLTAGAYASGVLPPNSVGSKQLKKNAVTRPKIADDSINSDKIADGTVSAADFAPGSLPEGPKGDTGLASAPPFSATTADASVPDGGSAVATASCPAGQNVVGGGATIEGGDTNVAGIADSYPEGRTGWTAHGATASGAGAKKMTVTVICTVAQQTGP